LLLLHGASALVSRQLLHHRLGRVGPVGGLRT
jgi:hypothetical protein